MITIVVFLSSGRELVIDNVDPKVKLVELAKMIPRTRGERVKGISDYRTVCGVH